VALSTAINASELNEGRLYPHVDRIREVSIVVAREVIRQSQREGLDQVRLLRDTDDDELNSYIEANMYDPEQPFGKTDGGDLVKSKL
jgi:malate dehydrogenase (oxaloacetate-decarboxylating)(NADP+)